jgi:hypothetical protein
MKKKNNAARKALFTLMVLLVLMVVPTSTATHTATLPLQLEPSYVKIWTNKDCGSHYTSEEIIVIYFQVTSPASKAVVTLLDHTSEDTHYLIQATLYSTNTVHILTKPAACPAGVETLEVKANISLNFLPSGMASLYNEDIRLSDTCYFYIDSPCNLDKDKDGFYPPGDCDDSNPLIYPGTEELCDGVDNDCDTTVDEGCYSCIVDWDYDSIPECEDCDDNDRDVYPDAVELCDGKDNDCDGLIDEECCTCYDDKDRDGYSDCWDINDSDPAVFPGSPPVFGERSGGCTGYMDKEGTCHYAELWLNKKCNAYINDATKIVIYFRVTSSAFTAKTTITLYFPEGESAVLMSERTISTNVVNSITGMVTCPAGMQTLIVTADVIIDGKKVTLTGTCSFRVVNCRQPDDDNDGHNSIAYGGTDCNDNDSTVYPGAEEVCDGKDNNCDGRTDEGFPDTDGDGYTDCGGDCDDTNPHIHPRAQEVCDGKDNDCDGRTDEGFYDNDQDGHAKCGGDCDDNNPAVYPGAEEVQDGIDNNCDGQIDEMATMEEIDSDLDGYPMSSDCNDRDPTIYPGAPELCADGKDNDCDGLTDCDDDQCQDDPACKKGILDIIYDFDVTSILALVESYKYYLAGGAAGLIGVILLVYFLRRWRSQRETEVEEEMFPVSEEDVTFREAAREEPEEKRKEEFFDRLEGKTEEVETEETFLREDEEIEIPDLSDLLAEDRR